MLVLARNVEEGLMIGDEIEIVVLEIKDGKVKLGINAPKHIKVFRKEILESIEEENQRASMVNKETLKFLSKKIK